MLQFKCAVTDKRHLLMPLLLKIAILSYCSGAGVASASDVVSDSGTAEDIQKAAEIARPGDSIVIPKGKFSFRGQVFLSDGVSVRGAGRNDTLLIKEDRLSEWKPMFSVDCKTGKPFSFSGITLQGAGRELQASTVSSDHIQDQGLVLRGRCRDFRIYGNRFTKFSRAGIELNGDNGSILGEPAGVIFENEFIDNWSPHLGYGIAVNGSATAWSQPLTLGSGQAVFVEDNYFEADRCAIQANNGARYVFRYNRISNNREDSAPIYSHGKGAWPRGTRSFEIYDNELRNDKPRWAGIALGGGAGVIFGNNLDGVSNAIVFMIEVDAKTAKRYPYEDQITDTWVWANNANGQPVNAVTLRATMGGVNALEFLQQDRDFFIQRKPNYQPFPYPHPARQHL
jgi:Right handed beta helix region